MSMDDTPAAPGFRIRARYEELSNWAAGQPFSLTSAANQQRRARYAASRSTRPGLATHRHTSYITTSSHATTASSQLRRAAKIQRSPDKPALAVPLTKIFSPLGVVSKVTDVIATSELSTFESAGDSGASLVRAINAAPMVASAPTAATASACQLSNRLPFFAASFATFAPSMLMPGPRGRCRGCPTALSVISRHP